jgi:hypothetical protein
MSTITTVDDLRGRDVIDSRDIVSLAADLREEGRERELTEEEWSILGLDDEQGGGIPGWPYGEALIAEGYFVEYAKQLAEDIGAIDGNADWPLRYIDWDAAADALKADYVDLEVLGSTYLARG